MRPIPSLLWILSLWLPATAILAAEPSPSTIIEANSAEIDDAKGISTYTGNVIITQGELKVEADLVIAHTHKGELLRVEAEGRPAKFRDKRENGEIVRGRSLTMDYDAKAERLLLIKQAELWQDNNHFVGERIDYDIPAKRALANSGPATDGQPKQRVQITIQPKQDSGDAKRP
jgi:lipopolysaccharide export system protein LptA